MKHERRMTLLDIIVHGQYMIGVHRELFPRFHALLYLARC
jgi:hypothetical protein